MERKGKARGKGKKWTDRTMLNGKEGEGERETERKGGRESGREG